MFPTKAPGLDGFPVQFFQRHWEVCGADVTKAVLRIVKGEETADSINETILVLIPKVKNPTLLSQFRPISLCNVIYKIRWKCLVNRKRLLLNDLISPTQSAFHTRENNYDDALIDFEHIDTIQKSADAKGKIYSRKVL